MGFRFRKSFGKGPLRFTVSKSGISTSVGVKGARITKKANGNITSTVGIPGTGLSYTANLSSNKKPIDSNKREKKTMSSSNNNYNNNNVKFYPDPAVEGVRTRPKGVEILWIIIATIGITFLSTGLVLVAGPLGVLGLFICPIVVPMIMTAKWRKQFGLLRAPVSEEEYRDKEYENDILNILSGTLTESQRLAYFSIIDFCNDNMRKEFSLAEINQVLDEPVSKYDFSVLFDLGFINRVKRGSYILTENKAVQTKELFNKAKREKHNRYKELVSFCESYNEMVRKDNYILAQKRQ